MEPDFFLLAVTCAAGAGVGLLYDCWQVLLLNTGVSPRRPVSGRRMVGFWLLATAFMWGVLAVSVAGMVRGFAFLGIALGSGLYYVLLSRFLRRVMAWIRRIIASVLAAILDTIGTIVLLPVRAVMYVAGIIVSFLTAVLATPGRWLLAGCERLLSLLTSALRAVWEKRPRRRAPPPE